MSHPSDDQLQDLVDGQLDAPSRVAVREHVSSCPSCAEVLAELESLKEEARRLAIDVDPPAAEWTRIEARISRPRRYARLRWAAGIVLALGLGGGAVFLSSRGGGGSESGTPSAVSTADPPSSPAGVGPAGLVAEAYASPIAELQAILAEGSGRLQPETLRVVEENLAVIEEAIGRAQDAIEMDPRSAALVNSLNSLYQTKVRVLSQAAALAREM